MHQEISKAPTIWNVIESQLSNVSPGLDFEEIYPRLALYIDDLVLSGERDPQEIRKKAALVSLYAFRDLAYMTWDGKPIHGPNGIELKKGVTQELWAKSANPQNPLASILKVQAAFEQSRDFFAKGRATADQLKDLKVSWYHLLAASISLWQDYGRSKKIIPTPSSRPLDIVSVRRLLHRETGILHSTDNPWSNFQETASKIAEAREAWLFGQKDRLQRTMAEIARTSEEALANVEQKPLHSVRHQLCELVIADRKRSPETPSLERTLWELSHFALVGKYQALHVDREVMTIVLQSIAYISLRSVFDRGEPTSSPSLPLPNHLLLFQDFRRSSKTVPTPSLPSHAPIQK